MYFPLTVGRTKGSSVSDQQMEGHQAKAGGDHVDARCLLFWNQTITQKFASKGVLCHCAQRTYPSKSSCLVALPCLHRPRFPKKHMRTFIERSSLVLIGPYPVFDYCRHTNRHTRILPPDRTQPITLTRTLTQAPAMAKIGLLWRKLALPRSPSLPAGQNVSVRNICARWFDHSTAQTVRRYWAAPKAIALRI